MSVSYSEMRERAERLRLVRESVQGLERVWVDGIWVSPEDFVSLAMGTPQAEVEVLGIEMEEPVGRELCGWWCEGKGVEVSFSKGEIDWGDFLEAAGFRMVPHDEVLEDARWGVVEGAGEPEMMVAWPVSKGREFSVRLDGETVVRVWMMTEEDDGLPSPNEPEKWVARRPRDVEVFAAAGAMLHARPGFEGMEVTAR
jgi:hypothetical protein